MMKFIFGLLILCLSTTWACADSVRLIDDPQLAFDLRMDLIENAKEEIQISYFIFAEDKTAMEMLALLRQKAREGVKVRLILDEMFNAIPRPVAAHLRAERIEIRNFNKFNLLKLGDSIKYRLHDKLFIIDRKSMIMGGRNIEDTYYARSSKNYDDRDVFIEGPLSSQAGKYFDRLWQAPHLTDFKGKKRKQLKASALLDQHLTQYSENKNTFERASWVAGSVEVAHLELFHDEINRRKKTLTGTAKNLYDLIERSEHSVLINSPYLILTKELQGVLVRTLARGVKIRILTNSLKSTDGLFPQAGYLTQRKDIVKMGIELFEYYGEDSLHSKSLIIDNQIAVIGSFNLDPRSQNLNTETMGVIHDQQLAKLLGQSMDENLDLSRRIDENGHPVGEQKRYPGVSPGKIAATKVIQYLIVPLAMDLL